MYYVSREQMNLSSMMKRDEWLMVSSVSHGQAKLPIRYLKLVFVFDGLREVSQWRRYRTRNLRKFSEIFQKCLIIQVEVPFSSHVRLGVRGCSWLF
jgi:hypothetical protein